jgi:hypothetical protein
MCMSRMNEPEKEKKPESYFVRGERNTDIRVRRNESNADTFADFKDSDRVELTDNIHAPDGNAHGGPAAIAMNCCFGGVISNCSTDGQPLVEATDCMNIEISNSRQGVSRAKPKPLKSKRQIVIPELPWERD